MTQSHYRWTDEQKAALESVIEQRLIRERRILKERHARELQAQRAQFEAETAQLRTQIAEGQQQRVGARLRRWVTRIFLGRTR